MESETGKSESLSLSSVVGFHLGAFPTDAASDDPPFNIDNDHYELQRDDGILRQRGLYCLVLSTS